MPVRDEGLVSFKGKADHYHYSSAAKPTHGVARRTRRRRGRPRWRPCRPTRRGGPHPRRRRRCRSSRRRPRPSARRPPGKKSRRANVVLNGKSYTQMGRCGKGGSAEVFRVQAWRTARCTRSRRCGSLARTPAAIAGYKGEIDLLRKLQDTPPR